MISRYSLKRIRTISVLASLVFISFIVSVTHEASALDDLSTDIVVNGNGGFSAVARSGTGSAGDPYVISDYNVSSANIQIKNTTSHVLIRNITFNTGSWSDRWGLYLYNADNVIIENVTSTGKLHFLYSILSQSVTVRNCEIDLIPSGNYVMEIRSTSHITFSKTNFKKAPLAGGSTILINNQGNNQRIIDCVFDGISLTDQLFHGTGFIDNCTFADSAVFLQGGNTGGVISNNIFRSPGMTALQLQATYRLSIIGNYFEGAMGIYFTGCQFQWSNTVNGRIENNTFEKCMVGIDTHLQNQNQPSRWLLKNNNFGNCSSYAINWQRGRANLMYRNIFYHNAGTDNSTAGSQVHQVNMIQFMNIWTDGTYGGNFWANHRTPDADVNGIVDLEYTFSNGGKDTMPFTNPYFDTERPSIALTNPRGEYSEASYIRVGWNAVDDDSGIGKIYLSVDGDQRMDVTDLSDKSIFLNSGIHTLNLTVFDKAGLYFYFESIVALNRTFDILNIEAPIDGEYYDNDPLRIIWSVRNEFLVSNQSITIDGNKTDIDTSQRVFDSYLDEGYHEISVLISDDQNLTLSKGAGFHIDRTPPVVNVLSPQPGSVLSNPIVSFNFEASDNIMLSAMMIKIDDGEWEDALSYTTSSRFLKSGSHVFSAEAVDMAGLRTLVTVPFTIGGLNGLNIISPSHGQFTSKSSIPFIWEYDGTFSWVDAEVRVGASADFQAVNQLPDGLIYLPDNEEYEITMRLVDEYDNYLESTVTVFKDDEIPKIVFLNPESGQPSNERDLMIEWAGLDDWGIESYSILINDGDWIVLGSSTTYNTSLEEGSHTIAILARDLAGNTAENRIEITMDYTKPLIELVSPKNGSIFKDPRISFFWKAEDDDIIEELVLLIEGNEDVDLLDRERYSQTFSGDSYQTVVLRARDRAGNTAEISSTFLIDSNSPFIEWGDGPGSVFSNKWANITFIIIEKGGIDEINLIVEKNNYSIPITDRYYNLTLDDGSYDLELTCIDLAGNEFTIRSDSPLIIDTIDPNITISMEETVVLNRKGVIYWLADGTGSDISKTEIILDGEDPVIMVTGNTFSTGVLMSGGHTILIRVYDEAGNSDEAYWTFEVEGMDVDDGGDGGGSSSWIFIVIGVAVLFIIGLLILGLLVLRKRGSQEKEGIINKQQEAPQLSLAKMAQNLPPTQSAEISHLPPSKEPEVEDRVDGTGYIRPARETEKGAPEVSRHRLRSDGRSIDHGKEDHGTVELGGTGKKEIGSPWEHERKKVLKKEAESVFVGQQMVDDEVHTQDITEDIPAERDSEMDIPIWGDETEEVSAWEEDEVESTGGGRRESSVSDWDDVEFDDDVEELEELEEFDDLEE